MSKSHTTKPTIRTKTALWLLIAPTVLTILALSLYALVVFIEPDLNGSHTGMVVIINILFATGVVSIAGWLPSIVMGIVLLATGKTTTISRKHTKLALWLLITPVALTLLVVVANWATGQLFPTHVTPSSEGMSSTSLTPLPATIIYIVLDIIATASLPSILPGIILGTYLLKEKKES